MDHTPTPRPLSTLSASGGDRFSQAPTVVLDVPSDVAARAATPAGAAPPSAPSSDDLRPPTAFANRGSTAFGEGSPSNLSVADSSQPLANTLPYRNSVAPTAVGSAQNLGDSDKEVAASDAPRGTSPFPDLGPQADDNQKNKRKRLFLILGGVAALAVVAAAVAVPVALTQSKKHSSGSSSSSSSSGPDDTGSGQNGGSNSDEWTLSLAMAADTANGGLDQLEKHYDTFITEEDFAQIAAAGLNWIRLPIPYWAIEKYPDEPFLEKASWKYVLKAFKWARKYGLRVNLDLHTIPGSQNGYNHSGKGGANGQINFLYGPMGLANAQRAIDYIRIITEFISQPEWAPVVPMFGIINEAVAGTIGVDQMTSFYLEVHDMMREITGRGQGKGPFISIHDSFRGLAAWKDLLPGHDRIALDVHPYLIFVNVDRTPLASQINKPCRSWATDMNNSWTDFGVSIAGEFSLAVNDCGQWINGIGAGTRWEGTFGSQGDGVKGDCTPWNEWQSWTQDTKDNFKAFALRNFDALGHWFFWTWKIGASSVTGKVETPMWSYQLGLQEGWIPDDPSQATGICGNTSPAQPLSPEMVGAAGTGQISDTIKAQFPWPPTTINPGLRPNNVRAYTATGAIPTLPVPTPVVGNVDGWYDAADNRPMYTPIAGCTYPDAWGSADAANPGPCGGATTDNTDNTDNTDDETTRRVRRVRNVIPKPRRTPAP
ncbi:hypothetical protein FRB90_012316 [Tulasnella sp. 427]|nr:hypothetical protein FRB90_012316 [Tulasnella sp. 427]